MVNYYDGIIGGIGTLLVAGAVSAATIGSVALVAFAIVALALVAHALFVKPPIDEKTDALPDDSSGYPAD